MPQGPRILGRQHIRACKHVQRPERDVARRPDRHCHQMQPRRDVATARAALRRAVHPANPDKFTSRVETINLPKVAAPFQ